MNDFFKNTIFYYIFFVEKNPNFQLLNNTLQCIPIKGNNIKFIHNNNNIFIINGINLFMLNVLNGDNRNISHTALGSIDNINEHITDAHVS